MTRHSEENTKIIVTHNHTYNSARETNRGDISRRGGQRSGYADSSNTNSDTIGIGIVSGPLNVGVLGEGCMFDAPDGYLPGGLMSTLNFPITSFESMVPHKLSTNPR